MSIHLDRVRRYQFTLASTLVWGALVTGCGGSGTTEGSSSSEATSTSTGAGGNQNTGGSASTNTGSSVGGSSQGGAGGMAPCKGAADCDDQDLCTTDACDAGTCTHLAKSNEDGNLCTQDVCDPKTGLVTHPTIAPTPDANGCTSDLCIPATGETTYTPVVGCKCAHSLCTDGPGLDAVACTWQLPGSNDDCAAKVCAFDGFCCAAMGGTWDSNCVKHAKDPTICPTGSAEAFSCACAHSYCTAGAALANLCDPCVKKICEVKASCCTTAWDADCVAATHSICQVPLGAGCQ